MMANVFLWSSSVCFVIEGLGDKFSPLCYSRPGGKIIFCCYIYITNEYILSNHNTIEHQQSA